MGKSLEQSRDLVGFGGIYAGQSTRQMRRSMRGADPTYVILDEPFEEEEQFKGIQWSVGISFAVQRAVDAYAEAQRKLAEAEERIFVAISNSMAIALQDVSEIIEEFKRLSLVPDAPQERESHGYAATCPRHGRTRGGTCIKCQRGRHNARW